MKSLRGIAAIAALAFIPAPAEAQDADVRPAALVVTAENLMAGDSAHQALAALGKDPNVILPGDVVQYRLQFTNRMADSIRSVVFTNPVPPGLRYVAGSAVADRPDVDVEFSIDGGSTYAGVPMVEEIIEGRRVRRPAPPESYTHIRWRFRSWLQPALTVEAAFRASLGAAAAQSPERPGSGPGGPALR